MKKPRGINETRLPPLNNSVDTIFIIELEKLAKCNFTVAKAGSDNRVAVFIAQIGILVVVLYVISLSLAFRV